MVSDKQLEYISSLYQDKCCVTKLDKAIQSIIKELKEYRAIGSIEKYKAADEKQKAKKPHLWGDGYYNGELIIDMYDCPNCEKSYELECEEYDYCPNCGQKLDWSEVE